jgi:hypothetical protein
VRPHVKSANIRKSGQQRKSPQLKRSSVQSATGLAHPASDFLATRGLVECNSMAFPQSSQARKHHHQIKPRQATGPHFAALSCTATWTPAHPTTDEQGAALNAANHTAAAAVLRPSRPTRNTRAEAADPSDPTS